MSLRALDFGIERMTRSRSTIPRSAQVPRRVGSTFGFGFLGFFVSFL